MSYKVAKISFYEIMKAKNKLFSLLGVERAEKEKKKKMN